MDVSLTFAQMLEKKGLWDDFVEVLEKDQQLECYSASCFQYDA